MKVDLSFGYNVVISSLSKVNIKSKNFFSKSCSVRYFIWECGIKSESLASFGHTTVISSLSEQSIKWKKLFSLVCYLRISYKKWISSCHKHKAVILSLSKLNIKSKNFFFKKFQNLYKVVQFGILFENVT